jgi:probable HAF family extracellular repeat protein
MKPMRGLNSSEMEHSVVHPHATCCRARIPALILAILVGAAVCAHAQYTAYNLGTLDGGTNSAAFGINNSGTIVGTSAVSGSQFTHAFSYADGVMTDLGAAATQGAAINSSGTIVGNSSSGYGFIYSGGVITQLGALGGGGSLAFGINNAGTVVGSAGLPGIQGFDAFSYSGGVMHDLGFLGTAYGINTAGTIAGINQANHAFSYSGGTMHDLGTLPGGAFSTARAINDTGTVVGWSSLAASTGMHAFSYSGGVMTDLGTLGGTSSFAKGINIGGTIVGDSLTLGGADHAFVDSGGVMTDLSPYLTGIGITGTSAANGIDDSGDIVGAGQIADGSYRAFLLVATPEPSTWALIGLGIAGLLAVRRGRAGRRDPAVFTRSLAFQPVFANKTRVR